MTAETDYGPPWEEFLAAISAAWPGEALAWSETPLELITRLIDERDELQQAVAKAVRGIRAEYADGSQGASETLCKICDRVEELADVLSVPCPSRETVSA